MNLASGAIPGKTQLLPTNYSIDNAAVVSSIGIYKKNPSARVGTPIVFIPYYYLAQNKGTGGSITPSNYYATLAYNAKGPDGKAINLFSYTQDIAGTGTIAQDASKQVIQDASTNGNAVWFIPELAGTYTITAWHDFNEDGKLTTGEISTTAYFPISYDYKPTVSYVTYGNAVGGLAAESIGLLAKVCLTNNYQFAGLNAGEGFTVTTNSATEIFDSVSKWVNGAFGMLDNANSTSYTLTSDNFGSNGCAYLNHFNTAAAPGSVKITFTGLGDGLTGKSFSISNSYISAVSYPITSSLARVVTNSGNLDGSYSTSNTATASASGQAGTEFIIGTPIGIATNITLSTTTDLSKSILFRVVDTSGKITGLKGATYLAASATASNSVTFSSYAQLDRDESYLVYVQGTDSLEAGNLTGTVAVKVKSQDRFVKYMVGYPSTIRGTLNGSTKVYLQVRDQFNTLISGAPIIPITTGRNSNRDTFPAYLSDSYGRVEWTLKDDPVNTNALTDLVKAKDMYGQDLLGAGLTINYGNYLPPSNIKITGAASEDKNPTYTKSYIDTSYAGASNTTVKMTATLLDANGNPLPAGVRVDWFVKGLDSKTFFAKDSVSGIDYISTFTDNAGQAITYIYSLGIGDVEVYAEADGVISTFPGKIHFANTPDDVRYILASSSEGLIKAKAEDRYGNPVAGVDLTLNRKSGKSYFPGQGLTRVNGVTDREGYLEYAVTGGDGQFEVKTTIDGFGQTTSQAGYVNGNYVSTSSVGGELTLAGITSTTIDVKSRDWNAETLAANKVAVDAADKANTAANLAAEKADNAILKAQEVQEAVAELELKTIDTVKTLRAQMDKIYAIIMKISKKIG